MNAVHYPDQNKENLSDNPRPLPCWLHSRFMLMNALNRKALTAGMAAALAVSAGIWLGSRALTHFDAVLIWYAIGSVLAAFAVAYRFAVWAQRPPSRLYLKRGLQLLFRRPRQPSPG